MNTNRAALVFLDDIPRTLGARKPRKDEIEAEQRATEKRLNVMRPRSKGILIDQQGRLVTDIVGNNGAITESDTRAVKGEGAAQLMWSSCGEVTKAAINQMLQAHVRELVAQMIGRLGRLGPSGLMISRPRRAVETVAAGSNAPDIATIRALGLEPADFE